MFCFFDPQCHRVYKKGGHWGNWFFLRCENRSVWVELTQIDGIVSFGTTAPEACEPSLTRLQSSFRNSENSRTCMKLVSIKLQEPFSAWNWNDYFDLYFLEEEASWRCGERVSFFFLIWKRMACKMESFNSWFDWFRLKHVVWVMYKYEYWARLAVLVRKCIGQIRLFCQW